MRYFAHSAVFCLSLTFFLVSCSIQTNNYALERNIADNKNLANYYTSVNKENLKSMRDLFALLQNAGSDSEYRFCINREICNLYQKEGKDNKLCNFLLQTVYEHPDDVYNAWYLLMLSWVHLKNGAEPLAEIYLNRIIKNHPDLILNGQSIHLASLKLLATMIQDSNRQISCYQELLDRFPDSIDTNDVWFSLGKAYEAAGEWDLALQTYAEYLNHHGGILNRDSAAFSYAKNIVDFNNSSKDWVYEKLDRLVLDIKKAIAGGNVRNLSKLMAKVNFHALSWGQDPENIGEQQDINFSDLLKGTNIYCESRLDPDSNAKEAWLRTSGWSQNISVWYLYFRKVNFPADSSVHGHWEWAGVFYGEKT